MAHAPQRNSTEGGDGDEPLNSCEFVFYRADRDDGRAFAGLEGDEKKYPDEEDGDDANG